ncbi:hypothetical protein PYCC9005_001050 [Savitreella phatthalungensis]
MQVLHFLALAITTAFAQVGNDTDGTSLVNGTTSDMVPTITNVTGVVPEITGNDTIPITTPTNGTDDSAGTGSGAVPSTNPLPANNPSSSAGSRQALALISLTGCAALASFF